MSLSSWSVAMAQLCFSNSLTSYGKWVRPWWFDTKDHKHIQPYDSFIGQTQKFDSINRYPPSSLETRLVSRVEVDVSISLSLTNPHCVVLLLNPTCCNDNVVFHACHWLIVCEKTSKHVVFAAMIVVSINMSLSGTVWCCGHQLELLFLYVD